MDVRRGSPLPNEKVWLIKSSTRIIGPYSLKEISEYIMRRQISILDEMKGPMQRWSYVRENPFLKEIIEAIRREQDSSKEDTVTIATQTSASITKTEPMGAPLDENSGSFMIKGANSAVPAETTANTLKEAVPISNGVPPGYIPKIPPRAYGSAPPRKKNSAFKTIYQSIFLGAIGLMIVSVTLRYVNFYKQDLAKEKIYGDSIQRALKYRSLGLNEASLREYNRASQIQTPDLDTQIAIAPLLVALPSLAPQGRAILESAVQTKKGAREWQVAASAAIGLSYWGIDDAKAEAYWMEALNLDVKNEILLLNLSALYLKKHRYNEFRSHLAKISASHPLAKYMKALAVVEKKEFNKESLAKLETGSATKETDFVLRPERELLSMYIKFRANLLTQEEIQKYVDQFPGVGRQMVKDPLIAWPVVNQDYLLSLCREMHEGVTKNFETENVANLLLSRCLLESGRDYELADKLKLMTTKDPANDLVIRLNIYSLFLSERYEDVRALIDDRTDVYTAKLGLIRALSCQKIDDYKCVEQNLSEMNTLLSENPYAYYILAANEFHKSSKESAYKFIREGLARYPEFIPLIELRDEMETQ